MIPLAVVLVLAMAVGVNIGGTWKAITAIGVNIGGTWKAVTSAAVNIGGTWKQFWTSGPTIASASASILQYGTAIGGICDQPHTNRITWSINGTCSGHTIRIYEPSFGEFATGLSCGGSPYDDSTNFAGFETSAGTGRSATYQVRLYDGSTMIDSLDCNTLQWSEDLGCL